MYYEVKPWKELTEFTQGGKLYHPKRLTRVSGDGMVRVYKENGESKFLKSTTIPDGHVTVCIATKEGPYISIFVHRLVASLYVPNPDPERLTVVNHIDEDKRNNCYKNLEWTTSGDNTRHSIRRSPSKYRSIKSRTEDTDFIDSVCRDIRDGYTVNDILNRHNGEIAAGSVYRIRRGDAYSDISEKYGLKPKSDRFSEQLTPVIVHKICKMLQDGIRVPKISEKFNIPQSTINHIYYGDTYTDISKNYTFPEHPRTESNCGKDSHLTIISERTVRDMCEDMQNGMNNSDIYKKYKRRKVTESMISNIRNGNAWKWVSKDYNIKGSVRGLTEPQIREICQMLLQGIPGVRIAEKFGVTNTQIIKIKKKKVWTEISDEYFKDPL